MIMHRIYIPYGPVLALFCIAVAGVMLSLLLLRRIRTIRLKLNDISEILDDIKCGNSNRKILAKPHDTTAEICYKINDIVHDFQGQIIDLKNAEDINKQLMTNFSHDVRTPLTTLIGYLDAAQKGIVVGSEREEYIETARKRAYDMKNYVDMLFRWFKLNSNEEIFTMEKVEVTELTRNILKNWIPIFENIALDFDIKIPDKRIEIELDTDAYTRILNNLIQNVISHSTATHIAITIYLMDSSLKIAVADNGDGIARPDLPHVFERLYKCDKARSEKGSGLGLSIVQKLVQEMGGAIEVESIPHKRTEFLILFPMCSRFIQG